MKDDLPKLYFLEKLLFLVAVGSMAVAGLWFAADWPSLVSYWNSVGQLSVYVGTLYFLLNARRFIAIIASIVVRVLLYFNVVERRQKATPDPAPAQPSLKETPTPAQPQQATPNEAKPLRSTREERSEALILLGVVFVIFLLGFGSVWLRTHLMDSAKEEQITEVEEQDETGEPPCIPSFCEPDATGLLCTLETDSSPTAVARQFETTGPRVHALALEMMAQIQSAQPEITDDTRIPAGTRIHVTRSSSICP